jgi:hypothetical protein
VRETGHVTVIEVSGREITGRVLCFGIPRALTVGAETFTRGAFGSAADLRAPIVSTSPRDRVVLARPISFTERDGALWGRWQVNPGARGDELLDDVRHGCVAALEADVSVRDSRFSDSWRAAPGVVVTRAVLVSVRPTGLDQWPDPAEVAAEQRAALLGPLARPRPEVDLTPIQALRPR